MKPTIKRCIGLMSGTSADGVDASYIETDGQIIQNCGPNLFLEYSADERASILDYMQRAIAAPNHQARAQLANEIAPMITARHQRAVEQLLISAGLQASDIDVVGFHGQTLFHDPETAFTLQAGDGQKLAENLAIPVVYDFRSQDMQAGGQGAPLVPVFHASLAKSAGLALPVAFVNIGGVANVTYIDSENSLLAFDTGPGNVLIDEWVALKTGERMDKSGAYAAKGQINQRLLTEFLSHDYFKTMPPKSLDRYEFTSPLTAGTSLEDGAATLLAMTVGSIAKVRQFMKTPPSCWIIVGGGAKNHELMRTLAQKLDEPVQPASNFGWEGGYIEAQAFGFLAARHIFGLPLTYPGTTGVAAPETGGRLAQP